MKPQTTILEMIRGKKIIVPDYQRAYSWDAPSINKNNSQVEVFLNDIKEYCSSNAQSPYYLGHFLFEKIVDSTYGIVDGQQRLTTIVIFLAAAFRILCQKDTLTENDEEIKEDMIQRKSNIHFSTVGYDNQFFKDYVIAGTLKGEAGCDTTSKKRIAAAYDYFYDQLCNESFENIRLYIYTIAKSVASTHVVEEKSEAVQMFIFQNNRGKKPSNLEIIKAQFMFKVHLSAPGDEVDNYLKEILDRFHSIYQSISFIERYVEEDNVLGYAQQVYYRSLWIPNILAKIDEELKGENALDFIQLFSQQLSITFEILKKFFTEDESNHIEIHSMLQFGGRSDVLPFVIKAYKLGKPIDEVCKLCSALESLLIRNAVIGTRADLTSRLNQFFNEFCVDGSIQHVINKIEWMKTREDWWGYWNNAEMERCLQGYIHHDVAKKLLWKYENCLRTTGKGGYGPIRYDSILNPHLEHIAPQTENPENGYCEYDEDFRAHYIDCLGNYLLLSENHNISIGNKPFEQKRDTYEYLIQQQEVRDMTKEDCLWDKDKIMSRKVKIIECIWKFI